MSIGTGFMAVALLFFFLAGIPQTIIGYNAAIAWGLFALTLGFLLSGFPVRKVVGQ